MRRMGWAREAFGPDKNHRHCHSKTNNVCDQIMSMICTVPVSKSGLVPFPGFGKQFIFFPGKSTCYIFFLDPNDPEQWLGSRVLEIFELPQWNEIKWEKDWERGAEEKN